MAYYSLLTAATLIIALLTWLAWVKLRTISIPLGIGMAYFWSLYGGWVIVYDHTGGDSSSVGFGYRYLYAKLFYIELDQGYFLALALYTMFIVSILSSLLIFGRKPSANLSTARRPLRLAHTKVLIIAIVAALLSFLILRDRLMEALALGVSGYATTRGGDIVPFSSLAQILNRVALVPLAIGLSVLFSGRKGRYMVSRSSSPLLIVGYLMVLTLVYAYTVVLGNKNELLLSLVSGALFYLVNCPNPKTKLLIGVSALALTAIAAIDVFRGVPMSRLASAVNWNTFAMAVVIPFRSNEMFGAHFSMYGALHLDLPYTYGSSILSLIASMVPRVFWPDRPPDVYVYYAQGVQAVEGQGYSIHHATGWYLNFGVPGVLVGGLLFGWVWATCINAFYSGRAHGVFLRVLTDLAPWTFVAGIPALIRAGPEGYKGLIVDSFVFPILALAVCCVRIRLWPVASTSNHEKRVPVQLAGADDVAPL